MVPRTELLAALSESEARQDEMQIKSDDLARLERQLSKEREQANSARQESEQLRVDMSHMVLRSDLDSASERIQMLESIVATEDQKQREAILALNLQALGQTHQNYS
jgi:hypothetical protein